MMMTPLIAYTIAWLAGIFISKWLAPPSLVLFFAVMPVCGGLILYYRQAKPRFILLILLMFLLGAARLVSAAPTIDAQHVAYYNDTDFVQLTAKIVDEPDIRDTYTNLRVEAQTVLLADETDPNPVEGLVLVRAGRYPQYNYGDTLEIYAQLETPPVFDTFSYKDYLARKNIYAIVRRPRIKRIAEQTGFSLTRLIIQFKTRAHQAINQILPEPSAALLNGILLGVESGIPKSLYESFNRTGASHVIVISGSNISLLVGIFLLAGQKLLGKRNATFLALGGVALYTLMVGADAAVMRAALMGSLYVIAMYMGRTNSVLTTLFGTALILTLLNPLTLWDVGFQLSFLATLGLIILVPPLENGVTALMQKLPGTRKLNTLVALLNEAVLVTIAAQIITTPLIIYQFGRFSVVSLLTNFLIVPVQPFVMTIGGLATLAGMVWLPAGKIIAWLAWLPLTWTIEIVEWTANFSWAQVELPPIPFWFMVLLYLTMGATVWWVNQAQTRRFMFGSGETSGGRQSTVFMGMGAILLLVGFTLHTLPDGKLHVAFLDIGQGDAILITTPRGRQILIDGGPSPAQLGQRLGQEMPFWDHSLNMVINTHPDADHLAGLVNILERYEVDAVLVSDTTSKSALYRAWEAQLDLNGQQTVTAWEGMHLKLDENVEAVVLNPGPHSLKAEAPNDHSVTVKIVMGEVSFLLSGDMESEVEEALAHSGVDLSATVFKSPHHGSTTSSHPDFLAAVNPQIVVISVGEDNRFGHPREEVLERYNDYGLTVFRTDELGTVELITDGSEIWLETRR